MFEKITLPIIKIGLIYIYELKVKTNFSEVVGIPQPATTWLVPGPRQSAVPAVTSFARMRAAAHTTSGSTASGTPAAPAILLLSAGKVSRSFFVSFFYI